MIKFVNYASPQTKAYIANNINKTLIIYLSLSKMSQYTLDTVSTYHVTRRLDQLFEHLPR